MFSRILSFCGQVNEEMTLGRDKQHNLFSGELDEVRICERTSATDEAHGWNVYLICDLSFFLCFSLSICLSLSFTNASYFSSIKYTERTAKCAKNRKLESL